MEAVFVGKERQYNRRFQQMCSPYLVQPPSIVLRPMADNGSLCNGTRGCHILETGNGSFRSKASSAAAARKKKETNTALTPA